MAEIVCSRCGSTGEGMPNAPLPGERGEQVLAQTCVPCWREWLGTQVKIINECSLSPANPEHFARLLGDMATFLNLKAE
ncbi:MAG: Fe(2+)-trafficking protein [Acidobacteriota bacterium]|nr:Fe(2+)-trafficking protein [Acidobacteriota bacterium]MDH3785272.1 Fe(2+)-trafficking protein [Acidobacteriota bacterium]